LLRLLHLSKGEQLTFWPAFITAGQHYFVA